MRRRSNAGTEAVAGAAQSLADQLYAALGKAIYQLAEDVPDGLFEPCLRAIARKQEVPPWVLVRAFEEQISEELKKRYGLKEAEGESE